MMQLVAVACILALASAGDECNEREKKKYEIMYCTSGTYTECCDSWCKSMCENLKASMENEECECDEPPEAFTSDSYCDDKADKFHEDHKKDDFETKMARACAQGCSSCCRHNRNKLFLRVTAHNATVAAHKHVDSEPPVDAEE